MSFLHSILINEEVSGGYEVLEMYIFGGILILTMLMAAFMTRKDSVVDDENGKDRCGKSGNRKRIVRERKSGKVVRID
ncbi:hypothetical protein [Gottfriedia acidiceleris]|uniref:hypothetical protein n=1 Tax=Gottfriedia acidiceleris TaxID=371036 RepID=UPI00101C407A|nr:hypothetical protein [Gottfriedia acidiceleris]